MEIVAGQHLDDYQITGQIGRGGMGTVYRATQLSNGRDVAIKMLALAQLPASSNPLDRFYREVKIIAQLQHAHIVPVLHFGEIEGNPYIVMPYLGRGSLLDRLKHGAMPLKDTLEIARQIASALQYAHDRDVVHRDIKPSNVLFDDIDNVYLADFGLAKALGSKPITASGSLIGTPEYMAPDWANGGGSTQTADLYALGVMIYHMLAGQPPYKAATTMELIRAHVASPVPNLTTTRPDIPFGVAAVVQRAMAKYPSQRYGTAQEVVVALENAMKNPNTSEKASRLYMPNSWAYYAMTAIKHAVGANQIETLLTRAGLPNYILQDPPDNIQREFPFDQSAQLFRTFQEVFGKRSTQALGRHAGDLSQQAAVRKPDRAAKITTAILSTVPHEERLRFGLETLANMYSVISDLRVIIEEDQRSCFWRMETCHVCNGWHADEPVCYYFAGWLEAMVYWMTGERLPNVTEITCMAKGDAACIFAIEKPEQADQRT